MSTSTSTTVEMTPKGHKRTTTTITFVNKPEGWVEDTKTVVIEEVEETGTPLLAPTWTQTPQRPYEQPQPYWLPPQGPSLPYGLPPVTSRPFMV